MNADCYNIFGSFNCECREGYMGDGFDCDGKTTYNSGTEIILFFMLDINECEDSNGGCEEVCVNNNGNFTCLCTTNGTEPSGGFCVGTYT